MRVGYMVVYGLLEYGIAEVTRLDYRKEEGRKGELVPGCATVFTICNWNCADGISYIVAHHFLNCCNALA